MIDYNRIADAITYINKHAKEQPKLDDIAQSVHLSPYHFHRLFKQWAGVTPKEFLQYISLNRAKKLLQDNQTIEAATFQTGFSSTSRLHDLFVNIEGMTPGDYKNGGRELEIQYRFTQSPFGDVLIASTGKGISNLLFVNDSNEGLQALRQAWPQASITEGSDPHIENIEPVFSDNWNNLDEVKLHIQGTDFQIKVWEALLKIPLGKLSGYADIAGKIGNPKASRAVGSAIGSNPVAYLIPCHRVIRKTGDFGGYQWGSTRKIAMIGWEAAQTVD